jgi:hypothetical protein
LLIGPKPTLGKLAADEDVLSKNGLLLLFVTFTGATRGIEQRYI